jgi:hypothetical protein
MGKRNEDSISIFLFFFFLCACVCCPDMCDFEVFSVSLFHFLLWLVRLCDHGETPTDTVLRYIKSHCRLLR